MESDLAKGVHQEVRLILLRMREGKTEPEIVYEILLPLNKYLDVSDPQYLEDELAEIAESRLSVNQFMTDFALRTS